MKHPVEAVSIHSTIADELLAKAVDGTPWVPYYNFMAKPAPKELIIEDTFLSWLDERYEFIGGILRMEPYHQYDWHIDTRRGVGINMLLNPDDGFSSCMFTETPERLVKNIYPIKYNPKTYYIFNTQQPHCVINFSKPRYLFSIEFALDKDSLSYDDLRRDVKKNYDRIKRST